MSLSSGPLTFLQEVKAFFSHSAKWDGSNNCLPQPNLQLSPDSHNTQPPLLVTSHLKYIINCPLSLSLLLSTSTAVLSSLWL